LMESNRTVRAGMLTPMANVSVAKRSYKNMDSLFKDNFFMICIYEFHPNFQAGQLFSRGIRRKLKSIISCLTCHTITREQAYGGWKENSCNKDGTWEIFYWNPRGITMLQHTPHPHIQHVPTLMEVDRCQQQTALSSCLQEITILLPGCLPSSYNAALREIHQSSGRYQSQKGSHLGYIISHEETPAVIMPGLWQWLSHGHAHCCAAQLIDSCKNMTAFITALDGNDTPGTYCSALIVGSYGIIWKSMGPWAYSAWSYMFKVS
jgi:hypothetical protein